ncbi:hypothetical protein AVEN_83070-1 [Araneus ventricosus]|uniref:DDE-1 domain-containing protein n=1 Tax=Araneus ventricosus TaxID=182803 RepID=A0A4Y2AN99_ARAVE|nr:hypothetical protein AVEN_83070-1 [Araneus ventricosus]
MDQGVIRSLKCYYRKQLIFSILECYDKNKDCDSHLLDAFVLLEKSWRLITESTIRNCFCHAGLTKTQQTEDDGEEDNNLPLSKWLEKHGVNAFSQIEIEHFECCDEEVITSGDVSEEDIVALVNEKNNSIVDSSCNSIADALNIFFAAENIYEHVVNLFKIVDKKIDLYIKLKTFQPKITSFFKVVD